MNSFVTMLLIVNFIPWLVALHRNHKAKLSIFISSLLLNWTLIGWVFNLIWACNSNTKN